MGNSIDPALFAAGIFLVSLIVFRRQQRRLDAMKTQLDNLSHAIENLRVAHEGLLVRLMNNPPSSRKARLGPSLGPLEHKTKQPDENSNRSALLVR